MSLRTGFGPKAERTAIVDRTLEALPVNDGGAGLVVLLLGDPHGLEGWEGGQDGATDPGGELPLWRSDDVDLLSVGGEGSELFL